MLILYDTIPNFSDAEKAKPFKNMVGEENKRAMMALYRSTGWYMYLGICLKHKTPKKD